MRIRIISPGKIKEKWLQAGIQEYVKRLGRYCRVSIVTVSDMPDSWPQEKAMAAEAEQILKHIRSQDLVVLLDLKGRHMASEAFAKTLDQWMVQGGSEIVFVIGGSNGLDSSLRERAQAAICLSSMTFTHQMTRLILLEQCYRAFRILRNEPYHK